MSQTAHIVSNVIGLKTHLPRVRGFAGPTSHVIYQWLASVKAQPQYEHVIVRTVDEAETVCERMRNATHRPSWLLAAHILGKAAQMAGTVYNVEK